MTQNPADLLMRGNQHSSGNKMQYPGGRSHAPREPHAHGGMIGREHHMQGCTCGRKLPEKHKEHCDLYDSGKDRLKKQLTVEIAAQKADKAKKQGQRLFTEMDTDDQALSGFPKEKTHVQERGHAPEKPHHEDPLDKFTMEYYKKRPKVAGTRTHHALKEEWGKIAEGAYKRNNPDYKSEKSYVKFVPGQYEALKTKGRKLRQEMRGLEKGTSERKSRLSEHRDIERHFKNRSLDLPMSSRPSSEEEAKTE